MQLDWAKSKQCDCCGDVLVSLTILSSVYETQFPFEQFQASSPEFVAQAHFGWQWPKYLFHSSHARQLALPDLSMIEV
jgi:hypothetical protein